MTTKMHEIYEMSIQKSTSQVDKHTKVGVVKRMLTDEVRFRTTKGLDLTQETLSMPTKTKAHCITKPAKRPELLKKSVHLKQRLKNSALNNVWKHCASVMD